MIQRKKLPIGIQTFSKIREGDYYYVDKTVFIPRLVEEGSYYFLSRPRRFGKSLFLDTLACAFEGRRELFTGLYLEDHWDWSKKYPVIRISFGGGVVQSREELDGRIRELLRRNQEALGIPCPDDLDIPGCFAELIRHASQSWGQRAVVLIDEYDKPILDNLHRPETAMALREGLRNFYSVIKDSDAFIQLAFLTGVSKFSKVSIFSGLNNLKDITLDSRYATICGYSEADLDTVFAPEIVGLDRDEIRRWYNGYRWLGEPVYNPFDLLLLFDTREYRAHWFETGTPTFLVNWLKERGFFTPRLERTFADDALLSSFDVDAIEPEAMLWQTGYLTIRGVTQVGAFRAYDLAVPNREVQSALNRALLAGWHPAAGRVMSGGLEVLRAFALGESETLREHFERLFASIPCDWYRANSIARYEGYFASVFYSHLAALGLDLVAEDVSCEGRCDLVVRTASITWVMEFKVVEGDTPTGEALAQIQAKNYAAKYPDPVILLGIEFSKTKRQIVGWQVQKREEEKEA